MSQFQFQDNNPVRRVGDIHRGGSGFSRKLIKWGLAKDEKQANMYLIALVVIGFGLIVYININTFSSPAPVDDIDPSLEI